MHKLVLITSHKSTAKEINATYFNRTADVVLARSDDDNRHTTLHVKGEKNDRLRQGENTFSGS